MEKERRGISPADAFSAQRLVVENERWAGRDYKIMASLRAKPLRTAQRMMRESRSPRAVAVGLSPFLFYTRGWVIVARVSVFCRRAPDEKERLPGLDVNFFPSTHSFLFREVYVVYVCA